MATKQGSLAPVNVAWTELASIEVSYSILAVADLKVIPVGGFRKVSTVEFLYPVDLIEFVIDKQVADAVLTSDAVDLLLTKVYLDYAIASDGLLYTITSPKYDEVVLAEFFTFEVFKEFHSGVAVSDIFAALPYAKYDENVSTVGDIVDFGFTKGSNDVLSITEEFSKTVFKEFFDAVVIWDSEVVIIPLQEVKGDGFTVSDSVDIGFIKGSIEVLVASDSIELTPIFKRTKTLNGSAFGQSTFG